MQLSLGRRWVIEFHLSFAVRKRMEEACDSVRLSMRQRVSYRDAALQWERDKVASAMLSSWEQTYRR